MQCKNPYTRDHQKCLCPRKMQNIRIVKLKFEQNIIQNMQSYGEN